MADPGTHHAGHPGPATPLAATVEPGRDAVARPWLAFAAVTLPLFLLMVDFYGIVVALPSIGDDLGGSTGDLGWVMNAFALGSSAPIIALGRLADLKGRKRMLLIGVVAFAACSVAAAVAPGLDALIVARGLAGVAGAMFFSSSLAIVSTLFGAERRGTAIGLWGGIGGIGSAVGPLVAGAIIAALSWRWFFGINAPLLAVAALVVLREVPESRDPTASRVDWIGFVLVTVGLVGVVFALQQAVSTGFDDPLVQRSLAIGLVVLAAFVVVERRVDEPLVDMALFRSGDYAGGAAIAFLANWAFGVVMFLVTLYLQDVVGEGPAATGAVFVVYSIPYAALGAASGFLARRLGARPLMAVGMGLVAAGAGAFAGIDTASIGLLVVGGLVLSGLGQGFTFNLSTTTAMGAVDEDKAGIASGMVNTVRMVGYSLGVAITSLVAKAAEHGELVRRLEALGVPDADAVVDVVRQSDVRSNQSLAQAAEQAGVTSERAQGLYADVFTTGMRAGMLLTLVVALIGVPVALLVRSRRRPGSPQGEGHHGDDQDEGGQPQPTAP